MKIELADAAALRDELLAAVARGAGQEMRVWDRSRWSWPSGCARTARPTRPQGVGDLRRGGGQPLPVRRTTLELTECACASADADLEAAFGVVTLAGPGMGACRSPRWGVYHGRHDHD